MKIWGPTALAVFLGLVGCGNDSLISSDAIMQVGRNAKESEVSKLTDEQVARRLMSLWQGDDYELRIDRSGGNYPYNYEFLSYSRDKGFSWGNVNRSATFMTGIRYEDKDADTYYELEHDIRRHGVLGSDDEAKGLDERPCLAHFFGKAEKPLVKDKDGDCEWQVSSYQKERARFVKGLRTFLVRYESAVKGNIEE